MTRSTIKAESVQIDLKILSFNLEVILINRDLDLYQKWINFSLRSKYSVVYPKIIINIPIPNKITSQGLEMIFHANPITGNDMITNPIQTIIDPTAHVAAVSLRNLDLINSLAMSNPATKIMVNPISVISNAVRIRPTTAIRMVINPRRDFLDRSSVIILLPPNGISPDFCKIP
jgi:hypothetical protein